MAKKAVAKDLLKPSEVKTAAKLETVEVAAKPVKKAAVTSRTKTPVLEAPTTKVASAPKAPAAPFEGYGAIAELSKNNLDAYIESGAAVAKGMELFSMELFAFTQVAIESNAAVAKALLSAKSLEEVVGLQTEYSRKSFDSFVAESGKLTELSVDLASQAIEPLKAQVNENVETLLKPLAA